MDKRRWIWKFSAHLQRFQHRSKRCQLYACACFLTFCASSLYLLILWNYTVVTDRALSFRLVQRQLWASIGNRSDEVGCEFPVLDPYSEEAMRFNRDAPKITCEGEEWVDCYFSECQVKKEILKRFRNVVCNYKDIVYVNDQKHFVGEATRVVGEAKYNLTRSDHVKVSCTGDDKMG